jgi:hypothetical protein
MAAGVEALVALWGAFERSWHSEWLALRATTPPAELNPKLCVRCPANPTLLVAVTVQSAFDCGLQSFAERQRG